MIVFWILLIFGVVFVVKALGSGSGRACDHETAPDILDKRYARGELSHDEYVAARNELRKMEL